MGWKSIEMQVALPRTHDAGKIQDQMQQRGQLMQDSLAQSQMKTDEAKRKRVNDFEQKGNVSIKDEDKQNSKNHMKPNNDKGNRDYEHNASHPYLGNRIDFTR